MGVYISLHGNELGFDRDTGALIHRGVVKGGSKVVYVTSAEILALNATPKSLVAAPGAGKALIFNSAQLYKEAGTAYAAIAAGEDLVVKYTNGSGAQASSVVEATGFLDSTAVQTRFMGRPGSTGSTAGDVVPVANAALVLHMLVGEVTTGTGGIFVKVNYDIITMALSLAS